MLEYLMDHYDLFISHSTRLIPEHYELALKLVNFLQSKDISVFFDKTFFNRGMDILTTLEEAISLSNVG